MFNLAFTTIVLSFVMFESTGSRLTANREKYVLVSTNTTVLVDWSSIIQPSIFDGIPPFIKFSLPTEPITKVPSSISKFLSWCSTVKLVNRVACTTGLKVKKTDTCTNWIGFFNGKASVARSPDAVLKEPYQRYNQLPGSVELCNKHKFWLNSLKTIQKFGLTDFPFLFESYLFPGELFQFYQRNLQHVGSEELLWILKPSSSTLGRDITVFKGFSQLPWAQHSGTAIIQKYLENPHKINGRRLRYRVYVLQTGFHPLRIYIYHDGDTNLEQIIAGRKPCRGRDRDLNVRNRNILEYWAGKGHNVKDIQSRIEDAIIKVMLIGERKIAEESWTVLRNKYNAYQFWTADFTFDDLLQPMLMEMNRYGSLTYENKEPALTRIPMLTETLNLAGYHFPTTLSRKARALLRTELKKKNPQHRGDVVFSPNLYAFGRLGTEANRFSNKYGLTNRSVYIKNILEELKEDDVRELMIAEDELSRSKSYIRIFPTTETYRYLKYLESDPYYYMLQDAWEHRYASDRKNGVEILNMRWQLIIRPGESI